MAAIGYVIGEGAESLPACSGNMAAPLSQELESLLNPQPRFWDPEDDQDEATAAKVIEKFDEGEIEDDDSHVILKSLKKQSASYLSDTDKRYQGKATSRKELRAEFGEPSFSGDSDEQLSQSEEGNSSSEFGNSDEEKRTDTEEDDFEDMEEEDDEAYDENQSSDEDSNEQGETVEQNDLDKSELQDGIQAFSKEKVSSDVAKGQGIRNQIAIWDHLLEGRIKIQKALLSANQLPQHSTFALFKSKGGSELASPLFHSYKALKDLMRSLAQLQDELLFQFPETRYLIDGKNCSADSDEEIPSDEEVETGDSGTLKSKVAPKHKLKISQYPEFMAKRFAHFKTYRNTKLQKWHDKTKLSGKISKVLGGSDRSIPMQIEQIMMDKERLLRRTQTKRSSYTILGKSEPESVSVQESALNEEMDIQEERKSNAQVKDLDEEIFDDDDFYHQLLRELIERRTSSVDPNDQVAMGRQWLAIQKLRSKIKKKVDTKASKGRKVRYQVHNKLVSFMAPIGYSTMNDEARTELYQSLFGKIKHLEPEKLMRL